MFGGRQVPGDAQPPPPPQPPAPELGWRLARLPRAAVLAAREARLPATLLGRYPESLVQLGVAGSRLTPEDLTGYRALGRAAAESGAALPSLVDLYLGVTWRVWDELPDAPGEHAAGGHDGRAALRSAALAVMRAADDAVAALCAGYQEARQAVARAEESLRREFVDGQSISNPSITRRRRACGPTRPCGGTREAAACASIGDSAWTEGEC